MEAIFIHTSAPRSSCRADLLACVSLPMGYPQQDTERTPLHYAVERENEAVTVVAMLLDSKAAVDAVDEVRREEELVRESARERDVYRQTDRQKEREKGEGQRERERERVSLSLSLSLCLCLSVSVCVCVLMCVCACMHWHACAFLLVRACPAKDTLTLLLLAGRHNSAGHGRKRRSEGVVARALALW